jgi:hypothetical protein
MKKFHIFTLVFIYALVNNKTTYAQTETVDTSQVIFGNQNALEEQLTKFGLKTLDFSDGANCVQQGKPLTKKGSGTIMFKDELPLVNDSIESIYNYVWPKVDGDINIYWIHGLNGSTESLRVPAQATQYGKPGFDARKVNSVRGVPSSNPSGVQYYSENGGITDATGDLNNVNRTLVPASNRTPRDFIIAHSQGGIVAREWLRNMEQRPNMYDKFAHGLVTFGSPHGGAEVLNNTRPNLGNKVPGFAREACNALGRALIEKSIKNDLLTRLLISQNLKDKMVEMGCNLISETVIPLALDNYYKRTTEDYYVGSPFLTGYNDANGHVEGLSEYTLKVPVVQFYGEEEQPVMWRFLNSTAKMGEDVLDNKEVIFGYNEDDQMGIKAMGMANAFFAESVVSSEMALKLQKQLNKLILIPSPYTALYVKGKQKEVVEYLNDEIIYKNASIWLINANDYYLSDLIGCKEYKTMLQHCLVIDELQCRDMTKNPPSSGLAPVPFINQYYLKPNSSGLDCDVKPINVLYANCPFKGLDGSTWNGNCSGNQYVKTVWKNMPTYKKSDGVVLMESASAELKTNRATSPKNTYIKVRMPKTNHDQMKNCTETKLALTALYNGVHGKFFEVGKR